MRIYRRGSLSACIRIDQITAAIGHVGPLPDESHPWDLCKGFVSLHRFVLETVEGRHLEYDVTTGELVAMTATPATPP